MLQEQTIHIDFTKGLDKKTQAKHVLPGAMTQLENLVFKGGTTEKRPGFAQLASLVLGGAAGASGRVLVVGDEPALIDSKVHGYGNELAKFVERGKGPVCVARKQQLMRNTAEQRGYDTATTGTVTLVAWEDSRGGIRCSVFDETTGTYYQADTSVSATGVLPRCLKLDDELCCFYLEGANLRVRKVQPATPQTLDAAVTIRTDADNVTPQMDGIEHGGAAAIAYRTNVPDITVIRALADGSVDTGPVTVPGAGMTAANGLAIGAPTDNSIHVVAHDSAVGLRAVSYSETLTGAVGPTLLDAHTATAINRIGLVSSGSDATRTEVFYEVAAANTYDTLVKRAFFLTSGATGAASVFLRSVGMAGLPFRITAGTFVPLVHESKLQPTLFLADEVDGRIVARLSYGAAGGLHTKRRLARVVQRTTTNEYAMPYGERGRVEFANGQDVTRVGMARALFGFELGTANGLINRGAVLNDVAYLPGGVLSQYDGIGIAEVGFNLFPENLALADAGAGNLVAGTYQVRVVFEWTNAKGQVERSSPSPAVSITFASSRSITATVSSLRLTQKTGARGEVRVNFYLTKTNGAVFFKVANIQDNNPANDTVSATLDPTMTELVLNEPLYTTGGELDHVPPPASRIVHVHGGRIVCGGTEDGTLWYSKQSFRGFVPGFNESLQMELPPAGGDVNGLGTLDGKLIILKETAPLLYVAGDGPNDAGLQNTFTPPIPIPGDSGCDAPDSIVEYPDGLFFRGTKGYHVLARSHELVFLGAGVEGMTLGEFGVLLEDKHQVRWYGGAGAGHVYDYHYRQWSSASISTGGATIKGAAVWNKTVLFSLSTGVLWQESGQTDNGTNIGTTLETGWLKLDGVAGFQRIWRAVFTGTFFSNSTLTIHVGFDYADAYSYNFTAASQDLGSAAVPLQLRHHLRIQKCQAIRFKVTDTAGAGKGFALESLALEVGLKKGAFRNLAAAKQVA